MKRNDEWYDVEKKLRAAMDDAGAESGQPPFEAIAGRIAQGEPSESFEEFFGEVF